jgi:predicted XRE-type DNA-binding protein
LDPLADRVFFAVALLKITKESLGRFGSDPGPAEEIEGDIAMQSEKLEVVRGSGNVFRDLGHENADGQQLKAILAAEIIKALDRERLSVRAAQARTGIAAADFSRIRNADLGRFTLDRLMSIINRLGSRVEVKVRVRRAESMPHKATA